jgi:hypothetical protein
MKEQVDKRLAQLKNEFERGQKILEDLDARREQAKQSLLRISGAILVLEEILKEEEQSNNLKEEGQEVVG